MAHEIETINNKASFFCVKDPAWHNLVKPLPDAPSIQDAMELAGLNWTVSLHDLYRLGELDPVTNQPAFIKAKTRMVVRDTDGRRLGEVGKGYKPLQNAEAFDFFNPFIASGEVKLESGGCLFNGERIFILGKLSKDVSVIVPGDSVKKYVLLANGHDGLMAVYAGFTPIRTVCWNTLSMAFTNKKSALIRVRHSASVVENLEKVREIMNLANEQFEATAEQYRFLASKKINKEDLKKYIKIVFKTKEREEDEEEVVAKSSEEEAKMDSRLIENKIMPLYEAGYGATIPGVAGTLWGAYNAVSNFLQWNRGRTLDGRLDSVWFGQSKGVLNNALNIATTMAKSL